MSRVLFFSSIKHICLDRFFRERAGGDVNVRLFSCEVEVLWKTDRSLHK